MKTIISFGIFSMFSLGAIAGESDSLIKTTVGGQGRLRFERSERTDYMSERSAFLLRVRPEVRLSKGSELSLFVQPQFSKAFGKPEFPGTTTTTNASQPTSGTTFDTSLGIHQATIEYRPGENFQFIFGRQLLSYGDELVLSGLDWDNVGRSFDALRARYSHGLGSVDFFYSKLFASKVTATAQGAGDGDLLGLYSTNNFGSGFSATDLYLLYRQDQTTGSNRELFALGARVKDRLGAFDYRVEATKEAGSQFTDAGVAYQIDLEAGWNFDAPFKSRIGLEVFHAGSTYDQLYPLAHKYLGIADIFGRRNIQGGVLHLTAVPTEGFTAQFDFHYLMRTSTSAPAYKLNGSTALGTGTNTSSAVGSELDLILSYAISKEITATLGGGVLLPGEYLKAELGDFNPTFWYAQWVAQL